MSSTGDSSGVSIPWKEAKKGSASLHATVALRAEDGSLQDEHGAVLMCGVTKSRRKTLSTRKVRRSSSQSDLVDGPGGGVTPFSGSSGGSSAATTSTGSNSSSKESSRRNSHGSSNSIDSNSLSHMSNGFAKIETDEEPEREMPSGSDGFFTKKEAHAPNTFSSTQPRSTTTATKTATISSNDRATDPNTQQQRIPSGWRRCTLISHLPALPPLGEAAANVDVYRGPTDESNWVVPGRLMVGAYPASLDQELHERQISSILELGIRTFVCLQREYDGNATEEQWRTGQRIRPYIHDAAAMLGRHAESGKREEVKFVHCPIVDCDTTADEIIVELATNLLRRLDVGETIYLHCWGGHGRAGTVASLLVGLLYGMDGQESMEYIQALHDTRRFPLDTPSPQTQKQRDQVSRILCRFYAEKSG